jgi:hypothetical protein
MSLLKLPVACLVSLAVLGGCDAALAQAYCALRDPVQTIFALYPSMSTYRSIVATVGESARSEIGRQLGMSLHHDELGRHTLYVALEGEKPIGLVLVRAERTQWGLAEIAWALDFDLRVVDFRIQRSRSGSRGVLESEAFRSRIRGSTAQALAHMLSRSGPGLDPPGIELSADDRALAQAIVTSGLKAISASQSVWGEDVKRLRTLALGAQ